MGREGFLLRTWLLYRKDGVNVNAILQASTQSNRLHGDEPLRSKATCALVLLNRLHGDERVPGGLRRRAAFSIAYTAMNAVGLSRLTTRAFSIAYTAMNIAGETITSLALFSIAYTAMN